MAVLNTDNKKHHTEAMAFLDEGLGMQRYDIMKYKQFDKLTEKQLGFFWQPQEVDVSKDSKDFKNLTSLLSPQGP
jgi:ribonucleoside-diphosphate reductase beta chain